MPHFSEMKTEIIRVIYVKECFLSYVSSKRSGLTFRSLIHFKFIFVYGIRECSNFILLDVAIQFSQRQLLKRCFPSILYSCLLHHRLGDPRYVSLSMGFLSYSTDLCFCFFVPIPNHLAYCSSALNLSKSSFGLFYNILHNELFGQLKNVV